MDEGADPFVNGAAIKMRRFVAVPAGRENEYRAGNSPADHGVE
jgi:cold shock CspA family protein